MTTKVRIAFHFVKVDCLRDSCRRRVRETNWRGTSRARSKAGWRHTQRDA
jgi:hypothetical protein